jgi:dienelactone hydrolase
MTIRQRLSMRFRQLRTALAPSEAAWRGAAAALWILVALIALAVLVTDVLPDFSFGKLAGFLIPVTTLLLIGLLIRLVLWLFSLLPRRYRASLFLLLPLFLLLLFRGAGPKGTGIVAVALLLITAMLGGGVAVLRREGFRPRERAVTLTALGIGLTLLIVGLVVLMRPGEPPNPALADFRLENRTLDLANPGEPGDHVVRTLTYGSGRDIRRPEYGEAVDLVSRSVDGSTLIDNWEGLAGWLRTRYWGFDMTELPLQGRVWYPEGTGPFPLVLIVHGNHGMEDFSDPGYAYLGELLASRGFIFVSVDENFPNGSFADLVDMLDLGLEEENDARAWLLLEHLAQWSDWSADSTHPFSGKVDMARVALIGHSRGGEAVAVAAAFNQLDRYPDDATLAFDYGFNIRGIIAIAPSDRQYEPRDRGTPLRDVNYFVIQGSLDGDAMTFMGSSQYSRIDLTRDPTGEDFHFKSTLYVLGANHGQFNTTWGRNDIGGLGFGGWALDTRPIMDPEEQRQIARVYVGAFLEVVLRDNPAYLPIFSDARRAAAWVPDTFYLQNHADSRDLVVANFDEDLDPRTTTLAGGRIEGEHLTKWREQWIWLKWNSLDTYVAVVAWDDEVEEEAASFGVKLPEGAAQTGPTSLLVFSLSAADEGSLPGDWEDEEDDHAEDGAEESDEEEDEPEALDWSIVLTDAAGESASLPLSHDRSLYPQIQSPTRRASLLEFAALSEMVFHRYAFGLGEFMESNPVFDPATIREIRFVFDANPKGVAVIDDVGFADVVR